MLPHEISLSDHRYIAFQVGDLEVTRLTYYNPKRTNWESYREDLMTNLGVIPRVIHLVPDVNLAVDLLQQAILSSYHQNSLQAGWFTHQQWFFGGKELSHLKASTGRLFNQAKRTGGWESYKTVLTCYNKEIRKTKQSSWRDSCQGIKDIPDRVRLMRVMAIQSANRVEFIKLPDA